MDGQLVLFFASVINFSTDQKNVYHSFMPLLFIDYHHIISEWICVTTGNLLGDDVLGLE